jgi:hypothetical protein
MVELLLQLQLLLVEGGLDQFLLEVEFIMQIALVLIY